MINAPQQQLSPAHHTILAALAARAVQDYLRSQAAQHKAPQAKRPNHHALQTSDKAA